MILLCVAVERGLGIDVPGVEVADNWMMLVMNALGLGSLRRGIAICVFNNPKKPGRSLFEIRFAPEGIKW